MSATFLKNTVRASAVLALAGALGASDAYGAGIFADFGGSWRGTGRISDVNGRSEALRCKATNTPSQDGIAMNLALVCASDSYRVDFHSDLYTDGQNLRGTWTETSRNASGDVQGQIQPTLINAVTTAPGFSAHIVIRIVNGRRLDVTLDAQGTSINHVAVSMKHD